MANREYQYIAYCNILRYIVILKYSYWDKYSRSGKFQCKKLRKAHTSTKLKHEIFTMAILLSNN